MFIALSGYVAVLSACSYLTDFVVVNRSDQTVQVRYRIRNYPGPFAPPVAPATIAMSGLSIKHNQKWVELPTEAYRLDQHNRTVIVELGANQVLRLARLHNYSVEDSTNVADFPVEELLVTGESGELQLAGEQVRLAFTEMSRVLYSLSYK